MKNKIFQFVIAITIALPIIAYGVNNADEAKILVDNGNAFIKANKFEDAFANYQKVINQFSQSKENATQLQVTRALLNSGVVLGKQGKLEEEIAYCDKVIKRFDTTPSTQTIVAKAFINKRIALEKLQEKLKKIADNANDFNKLAKIDVEIDNNDDAFIRLLSSTSDVNIQLQIAEEMNRKSVLLNTEHLNDEAIKIFGTLINRFGISNEPMLQAQIAFALFGRGRIYHGMQSSALAVKDYDELIKRYSNTTDNYLKNMLYKAYSNKASILSELGNYEKAIVLYSNLIDSAAKSNDRYFDEMLAIALVNKGIALYELSRLTEALPNFNEVIQRFDASDKTDEGEKMADAVATARIYLERIKQMQPSRVGS